MSFANQMKVTNFTNETKKVIFVTLDFAISRGSARLKPQKSPCMSIKHDDGRWAAPVIVSSSPSVLSLILTDYMLSSSPELHPEEPWHTPSYEHHYSGRR